MNVTSVFLENNIIDLVFDDNKDANVQEKKFAECKKKNKQMNFSTSYII